MMLAAKGTTVVWKGIIMNLIVMLVLGKSIQTLLI